MLLRTHLSITLFFILLFISSVENKAIFVIVSLAATYIPDIDTPYGKIGRKKIFRFLQFFTKHRGIFHSFTLLFMLFIVLLVFYPAIAFGFFVGYGSHLFADSFTLSGIRPFYPWKKRFKGFIRTGGALEILIFLVFMAVDIYLIYSRLLVSIIGQ